MKVDYSTVQRSIQRLTDLSKNFAPLFQAIVGQWGDKREYTIIGGINRGFLTQTAPDGEKWQDLSESYAKRKNIKWAGRSILIASSDLFNSLVYGDKGNLYIMEPKKLSYGTVIPYMIYHMEGTSKMPIRQALGFSQNQIQAFRTLISSYIKDVWENKK